MGKNTLRIESRTTEGDEVWRRALRFGGLGWIDRELRSEMRRRGDGAREDLF
jgi:hypothetical protein